VLGAATAYLIVVEQHIESASTRTVTPRSPNWSVACVPHVVVLPAALLPLLWDAREKGSWVGEAFVCQRIIDVGVPAAASVPHISGGHRERGRRTCSFVSAAGARGRRPTSSLGPSRPTTTSVIG